jgi:hypothetical protein
MKTTRVIALTMMMALGGGYAGQLVHASAAQSAPATATRKGQIKKIDDSTLVMIPSDAKKTEATYALSADTKKTGSLAVGDEVEISYHYERGKVVVTAVMGKTAK